MEKNKQNLLSFILVNSDTGEYIEEELESNLVIHLVKNNGESEDISSNNISYKGFGIWVLTLTENNTDADHIAISVLHPNAVPELFNIYLRHPGSESGGYITPGFFDNY